MHTDTLTLLRAGKLAGIRRLDLSCGLTEFPPEIFTLADSLEVLNLSGNRLDSLPADLHLLHRLQAIFCSDNQFTELPIALGKCARLDMVGFKANQIAMVAAEALPLQLRWLILTDNRIVELPAEVGLRPRLQKLMLAGNRLHTLPEAMSQCTNLELLRISANAFESLPAWLTKLPRLAWLAYAGNPVTMPFELAASEIPIQPVNWQDLELGALLGEGASGVIHQATDSGHMPPRKVAVKLFKSAITSDGSPVNEMAACMSAGSHAGLIGAIGRICNHPGEIDGLVMPLVDATFQVLAAPPSLASCTRDVYPEATTFTGQTVLSMSLAVASAVAHLHRCRMIHGDLYAHNILHDNAGSALLGDFGAATLTNDCTTDLQKIESRAFGCLLEELISQSTWPADKTDLRTRLEVLRDECLQEIVKLRPLFAEIESALQQLLQEFDRPGQAT